MDECMIIPVYVDNSRWDTVIIFVAMFLAVLVLTLLIPTSRVYTARELRSYIICSFFVGFIVGCLTTYFMRKRRQ